MNTCVEGGKYGPVISFRLFKPALNNRNSVEKIYDLYPGNEKKPINMFVRNYVRLQYDQFNANDMHTILQQWKKIMPKWFHYNSYFKDK